MVGKNNVIKVLNVPFLNITKDDFIEKKLMNDIAHRNLRHVVTANPEIVIHAKEHNSYFETIKKADYIVADGIGVILASRVYKTPLPERIAGFEVMEELLKKADLNKYSIYLFGAKEGVAEQAAKRIKSIYKNVSIAGTHHGFVDIDDMQVVDDIRSKKPDIIFVALGYPKQENWIQQHINSFQSGIFIGIGGSIDVWAGVTKRAPALWQKLNIEWLYRFINNPKRIGRFIKLPLFLIEVFRDARKKTRS
ncbi:MULTISPECIES: WecB/TagA/CpsF family glycosyltransferase [Allobacillus]|uniref:N-acetylglucosaminyldiphosphoundecaprenol N-acetyl-beta-D-mannosaminyltransferase n=1 Tax=Allobacillus salarius TaxID=1955272 RepID=A0A556PMN5_9BACI|nr:WecB/TagA/CpsF family glycosyltransferase [Allobacillus salarius]TSJ65656.1 WecB/TagA/CpsF family glycosyltransferase [Allobacillus salarius]